MATEQRTRDELAEMYLAQLPYAPYPVQEEALLAWFTSPQGVLVCAPTGTGKTLIAHAALYEALHTQTVAYYTTPLIALTEQKFQEMQAQALRWGFKAEDVGLVTGNRRVNPSAKVLVVVAEILLNRLLNQEEFDFSQVSAVVMDEFHSFADPERGIVWELSLSMLPTQVRLLLLSATVGNSQEFIDWLRRSHGRDLELVEGRERKVPLSYHWVGDHLLGEQLTLMAEGAPQARKTPALVFCFNRDECWVVADQLKGLDLLSAPERALLAAEVDRLDWPHGVGPRMKQLLRRGVGIHHAGLLPKYRRVVEDLFERKMLAVAVCTETLAAGINLPARSVVLSTLLKGPHGAKKLVDSSVAHQIFGRAGRPQFDDRGYVYVLAHEDDVKILRWKEKYDAIPEHTGDPGLLKAKKSLWKKRPTRRDTEQYWNEAQFEKLKVAPPGKLYSKGPLPWRLLAYLLQISPDVERIRAKIRKRLLDAPRIKAGEAALDRMLLVLSATGFVTLEPPPPKAYQPKPRAYEGPESLPAEDLFGNRPVMKRDAQSAAAPSTSEGGPSASAEGSTALLSGEAALSKSPSEPEVEPEISLFDSDDPLAALEEAEGMTPPRAVELPIHPTPVVDAQPTLSYIPFSPSAAPAPEAPPEEEWSLFDSDDPLAALDDREAGVFPTIKKDEQDQKNANSDTQLATTPSFEAAADTGNSAFVNPPPLVLGNTASVQPLLNEDKSIPGETPRYAALFSGKSASPESKTASPEVLAEEEAARYLTITATPTPAMEKLLAFRSIHPLYGAFLLEHLGIANRNERIQILESVLEMPRPLLRYMRVPERDEMPPGPLESLRVDPELIKRGLMIARTSGAGVEDEEDDYQPEERPPALAEKLRMLFESVMPGITDVNVQPVWAAGELLRFGGDFNKYVKTRDLTKQEGIVFRHLLRLILLCGEFQNYCPVGVSPKDWQEEMRFLADVLTASCREIDPDSTDQMMEMARAADVVQGEGKK